MKWLDALLDVVALRGSEVLAIADRAWEIALFFGPYAAPAVAAFLLVLFLLRRVANSWKSRAVGYGLVLFGLLCGGGGAVSLALLAVRAQFGGQADATLALFAFTSSPFCIASGWMLAAGRKTLVLFLRRFGNEELNDAVRELVRKRCRGRARLVTLDDSRFSPAGPRWSVLVWFLIPTAIALGIAMIVYPIASGEIRGEGMFGGAAAFVLLVLDGVIYVACGTLVALGVVAARSHFIARPVIGDDASMRRLLRRLRGLRSLARAPAIFAPTAAVVSVADPLWQAAVAAIGRLCDTTLIDITFPRPHICWELENLREANARIILLAQRDELATWWEPGTATADDATSAELRRLASSFPLVIYDAPQQVEQAGLGKLMLAGGTRLAQAESRTEGAG
jgi:hypothetical protein